MRLNTKVFSSHDINSPTQSIWGIWWFVQYLGIKPRCDSSLYEGLSVQFSHSVVFDSLWPHEPQHTRPLSPVYHQQSWPVYHQLPESTQNRGHRVSDAIQPSHPLSSPSPPDLNLSQHQGLFKLVSSSHQVAKVLEFQPQHQSFQWTPRTDLL